MAKRRTGPTRYAIYLRCSTDDQKQGDFTTLDVQREKNTEFVARRGGTLVAEYADEGKTGTNLKRSGYDQLLQGARSDLFDVVVVTYMSRLARGTVYYVAEHQLKEVGVAIELVQEHFTPDLAGHVNKQMTILMDAMYPKMVSNWTKTKMERMVANGYFCGGTIPFGYCAETVTDAAGFHSGDKEPPKRLVPDPAAAPLVRRAFEVFSLTRSVVEVQEYLRSVAWERGLWGYDAVKRLLTNDRYRGVLRFGQWVNHTAHEAIISEALWDEVQAAIPHLTRSPKRNPKDKTAYYLRGLVFCPTCGYRMTPADHHGANGAVRYYECINAHKNKSKTCPVRRVNAFALHEAVVREIQRAVEHPTYMDELIRESVKRLPDATGLRDQQMAIKRRLKDVERKIRNCTEGVEATRGSAAIKPLLRRLEELEMQRENIEKEQHALEAQIAAADVRRPDSEQVRATWGRLTQLWEAATDEEKAELLPLIVEKVAMKDKERGNARLLFATSFPRSIVGLTSQMGAGMRSVSIYPDALWLLFDTPHGGRNRKKQPRPWQKAAQ